MAILGLATGRDMEMNEVNNVEQRRPTATHDSEQNHVAPDLGTNTGQTSKAADSEDQKKRSREFAARHIQMMALGSRALVQSKLTPCRFLHRQHSIFSVEQIFVHQWSRVAAARLFAHGNYPLCNAGLSPHELHANLRTRFHSERWSLCFRFRGGS